MLLCNLYVSLDLSCAPFLRLPIFVAIILLSARVFPAHSKSCAVIHTLHFLYSVRRTDTVHTQAGVALRIVLPHHYHGRERPTERNKSDGEDHSPPQLYNIHWPAENKSRDCSTTISADDKWWRRTPKTDRLTKGFWNNKKNAGEK